MARKVVHRVDTAANWTLYNTVLLKGERGRESDTGRWKTGDGVTGWNDLLYDGPSLSDFSALGLRVSALEGGNPVIVATGIALNNSSLTVATGSQTQLTATVAPANVTDPSVTWSVMSGSVTVNAAGLVTIGSVAGSAIVRATNSAGQFAECTFTIQAASIPVTGVTLDRSSLSIAANGTPILLTATVAPSGATNKTGTWSSSSSAATVSQAGLVTPVTQGSATITFTSTSGGYTASCEVTVTAAVVSSTAMKIGINLWDLSWGNTVQDYLLSTVWSLSNWVGITNPWKQAFLDDLSIFTGPIRFMDWDCVNWSPIVTWSQRIGKTENCVSNKVVPIATELQTYFASYISANGTTNYSLRAMPYEWMIDLCNRTGRDMWVCVPTFVDDDYVTQLATLINSTLDAGLKCYLEYSNETWNTGFQAIQYHQDKGVALGLPGANSYYKGQAYHVLRSLQVFKIFTDVFGSAASGLDKRLVRVLSGGGNGQLVDDAVQNIVFDGTEGTDYTSVATNATYNPHGLKPDIFCFAPYFGSTDGLGATATLETTKAGIDDNKNGMSAQYIAAFRTKYKFPCGCYECGSGWVNNADVVNRKPEVMYPAYLYYWDTLSGEDIKVANQYTLYSSYDTLNAWGLKRTPRWGESDYPMFGGDVPDTYEAAPKYKATMDWIAAHSAGAVATTGITVTPTSSTLTTGATLQLSATVTPSDATNKVVSWLVVSGDATVSASGLVTAGSTPGTVVVRAANAGGQYADCTITVQAGTIAVTGVSVDPATLSLAPGSTSQLAATIAPSNATTKTGTWSSSNSAVAAVSSGGLVTAVANGSATITFTTTDGSFMDTTVVTVAAAATTEPMVQLGTSAGTPTWGTDRLSLAISAAGLDGFMLSYWDQCRTPTIAGDGSWSSIWNSTSGNNNPRLADITGASLRFQINVGMEVSSAGARTMYLTTALQGLNASSAWGWMANYTAIAGDPASFDAGLTEAAMRGPVWFAHQFVVDTTAQTLTIKHFARFGLARNVVALGSTELSFATIRSVMVANGIKTQSAADAYTPSVDVSSLQLGVEYTNMTHARLAVGKTTPTLSELLAISTRTTPDSGVFAWWPLVWRSGAAYLNDDSGNARHLTLSGTAYQGPASPV